MLPISRILLRFALCFFVALLIAVHLLPVPETEAQRAIVIPPDRAGLKGIVGHWWYADRYGARLLDEYAAVGATNVRLAIDWLHIEPVEGQLSFDKLDPIIFGLKDRGIDVLPVIATMPPWATWNGEECFLNHLKCRLNRENVVGFKSTMSALARHYPQIRAWEFWNEPEMWEGMRDPAEYEFWYRAFYTAVKGTDPSIRVGIGTLTGWDFVQQLSPDVPYDAVSVHSYGDHRGDPIETDKIYNLFVGTRSRGRDVPIWLTEYGWNSNWLDSRGVAGALDWTFRWLLDQPYIEFAHYHMLHDTEEYWECCFGLLGPPPNFTPKMPAWDRFRGYQVLGR